MKTISSQSLFVLATTTTALLLGSISPSLHAADFRGLGDLPGGSVFSVATGVSADGKVVCGYSSSTNSGTSGYEAVRWTEQTGMVPLGDLAGGVYTSFALAISADGTTVVGNSKAATGDIAFRWTQSTGMTGLGDLPGGDTFSIANAVSGDGSIVVGNSASTLSGTGSEAFRWTSTNGMEALGDLAGGNFNQSGMGNFRRWHGHHR